MQTILHPVLGENPGFIAGAVLLGIMALYAAGLCFGVFRRLWFQREEQALARERLRQEIKAARLRCQEVEHDKLLWNGYRKFEVIKKVVECEDVVSFYLAPHDKRPLPPFKPGQYITFQVNLPGQSKPVVRCYSLSDSHRPNVYRVTIKRALPPPDCADGKPGLISSHFRDNVREGDILDVKAPSGHFYLDLAAEMPVVLISAGVGITPMISMLNALIDAGSKREVWFFFGARNRSEHPFKEHLEQVAARYEHVRLHVCYSRPDAADTLGRDFHHTGRVTIELLKELLPSSNYEYFLCGPGPFMKSLTEGLSVWGVPDQYVHFEAFGPASVKKAAPVQTASDTAMLSRIKVTFNRLGKTCAWNPATASLLDFAEEHGVKIDAGCRAGNCGTCLVAIKAGTVKYLVSSGAGAEQGSCLACICKPATDLVIDA